jgi:hypothetical protein
MEQVEVADTDPGGGQSGQIGAAGPGVANNAGAGVRIADAAIVDVSGRITGNVGLGIDLATAVQRYATGCPRCGTCPCQCA